MKKSNESDTLPSIKNVDESFTDLALSLLQISRKYLYNAKYISSAFKKKYKVGLNQYITTLRIQYACTLIEQGFTSVESIASLCGYSEPLYFSKVFKTGSEYHRQSILSYILPTLGGTYHSLKKDLIHSTFSR